MMYEAEPPPLRTEERPPTVLLVEDNEHLRYIMMSLLVQEGYAVLTAASGHDALALLQRPFSPIDVVLLDMCLPDMNGIEVCEYLRRLHPKLPVIVCTAGGESLDASRLLELGVQRFFIKPISPDEVLASVEAALP
jgi:DNA-binding response OmpR family regulator